MKDGDIKQYNEIMKEKIKGMTLLNEKEVIDKFNGIRLASENEKREYLEETYKLVNGYLLTVGFLFLFFAVFFIIISNGNISRIIGALIFAGLGVFCFFWLVDEEQLTQFKQDSKLYIADCFVYEIIKKRKRRNVGGASYIVFVYYAKITDMVNGYLEKEIRMEGEPKDIENNMIKAPLFIKEYKGEYTMKVLYEKSLKQ